jgi:hypothetical protein
MYTHFKKGKSLKMCIHFFGTPVYIADTESECWLCWKGTEMSVSRCCYVIKTEKRKVIFVCLQDSFEILSCDPQQEVKPVTLNHDNV